MSVYGKICDGQADRIYDPDDSPQKLAGPAGLSMLRRYSTCYLQLELE